jgi:hypothetical protein
MNVTFKSKLKEDVLREEHIIVGGEVVGEMLERTTGSRYHAVFNVAGGNIGLIQGFGPTKEEAIQNAVSEGRIEVSLRTETINQLAKKLEITE